MELTNVLILCTGNSCRSQMAEGWLRHIAGDRFRVFSAGTRPTAVNPMAIRVMREAGIDISSHTSRHLSECYGRTFSHVITVCDNANESCPVFPGDTERIHWSFDDPAHATGSEEEKLALFRRVRDEIERRLRQFVAALPH